MEIFVPQMIRHLQIVNKTKNLRWVIFGFKKIRCQEIRQKRRNTGKSIFWLFNEGRGLRTPSDN